MVVKFGKLEGSVGDGAKYIDIMTDDGTIVGAIEIAYRAENIGATRRKAHFPDYVDAYLSGRGLDLSVPTIPVVGSTAGLIKAVREAKAAVTAYVASR